MRTLRRSFTWVNMLLIVLATVAGSALWGAMPNPFILALSGLGAVTAFLSVILAERFKLAATELATLATAAMLIVGGVAAGTIPTADSYDLFFRGLISGWARFLTSVPPVGLADEFRVLPYISGWLAAVLGLVLVRHLKPAGLCVLGPVGIFVMGLLFSTGSYEVALIQGAAIIGLSLVIGAITAYSNRVEVDEDSIGTTASKGSRLRLLSGSLVILLVAAASPFIADNIPGFSDRERFDLRSLLEPPWDPLDESSPLAQLKDNYATENKEEVVFTASGEQLPRRWSLATLAHFDGEIWTVGDSDIGGDAQFITIDSLLPAPPEGPVDTSGTPNIVTVKTNTMQGPWLPVVDRTTRIDATDAAGDVVEVRVDNRGRTLAAPKGASELTYTLEAFPQPEPSAEQLASATVSPPVSGPLELQAATVRNQAADMLEGVNQGWPQAEKLASELKNNGYYQADEQARPGHSWGRLSDFSGAVEMVGNEEQYAALAGVIARNADLPVRIVVGYIPDTEKPLSGEITITRSESAAWLEIRTDEFGWVPIEVTPDRDQDPTPTDPGFRKEFVAPPNPPTPPPEQELVEQDQEEEEEADETEDETGGRLVRVVAVAATAAALPLIIAGMWLALVLFLKRRRRRKRRKAKTPSLRIAGAWYEANDRIVETGLQLPKNLTVAEQAEILELTSPELGALGPLASTVDQAAFATAEADDDEAEFAWELCGEVVSDLRSKHSTRQRLAHAANPATLVRTKSKL